MSFVCRIHCAPKRVANRSIGIERFAGCCRVLANCSMVILIIHFGVLIWRTPFHWSWIQLHRDLHRTVQLFMKITNGMRNRRDRPPGLLFMITALICVPQMEPTLLLLNIQMPLLNRKKSTRNSYWVREHTSTPQVAHCRNTLDSCDHPKSTVPLPCVPQMAFTLFLNGSAGSEGSWSKRVFRVLHHKVTRNPTSNLIIRCNNIVTIVNSIAKFILSSLVAYTIWDGNMKNKFMHLALESNSNQQCRLSTARRLTCSNSPCYSVEARLVCLETASSSAPLDPWSTQMNTLVCYFNSHDWRKTHASI